MSRDIVYSVTGAIVGMVSFLLLEIRVLLPLSALVFSTTTGYIVFVYSGMFVSISCGLIIGGGVIGGFYSSRLAGHINKQEKDKKSINPVQTKNNL